MRIDSIDKNMSEVLAPAAQAGTRKAPAVPEKASAPAVSSPQSKPVATWQSPQHEVNVVLDDNKNIVYRFVDKQTGEVVQQIPPEEMLRMMQSIQQLLQKPEQKLKVTL